MPKVGFCENLPIAMILGRDWQMAIHATITIKPNGAVCISTPTGIHEFGCVKTKQSFLFNRKSFLFSRSCFRK